MDLEQHERDLIAILARESPSDTLAALINALKPEPKSFSLSETAIGLDSSVFLRLGGHPNSEDILDYLRSKHTAPLILPGQAIQEFWNNQLHVVATIAANIKKKFEAFQSELKALDPEFVPFAAKIDALLDEFQTQHGHVYDENTLRKTLSVLELLQQRAIVPYASRARLKEIALWRKATKTPPGFKDEGDGDFFIWADFLTGLQSSRLKGMAFSRAILVTRDQKTDWSRSGNAHPILVAEAKALLNIHFEIWDDGRLSDEIKTVLAEEAEPNS